MRHLALLLLIIGSFQVHAQNQIQDDSSQVIGVFRAIYFNGLMRGATLDTTESKKDLVDILAMIALQPNKRFVIEYNLADSTNPMYSVGPSVWYADAICTYLYSKGISSNTVTALGNEFKDPIIINPEHTYHRWINKRVVLKMVKE